MLEALEDRVVPAITFAEVEANDTAATANFINNFGTGFFDDPVANVTGNRTAGNNDFFSFDLRAGDIIGANITGLAGATLSLQTSTGTNLMTSSVNVGAFGVIPPGSPLPLGGNANLQYVVATSGTYTVGVTNGTGAYNLQLRAFRPSLELAPAGARQILFLDFDGETINTSAIFNQGPATSTLSDLDTFLPGWGLTTSNRDAVIDAIVAEVDRVLNFDIASNGNNGSFDVTGRPGSFSIDIRNSRDHADPFGQPNVSRVIIGGTIAQFGIPTLGISSTIDVGNFDRTDQAVVLLDLLSGSALSGDSINSLTLAPGASIIDAIGRVVGQITAHEAGHFFGNYHQENNNGVSVTQDQGGNGIADEAGVGPDGIFGNADDILVTHGPDAYESAEPFTGIEDARNVIAFGLATSINVPYTANHNPTQTNIANDGQPDVFRLVREGNDLNLYINGNLAQTFPFGTQSIVIQGSNDDDTLIVDSTNGLIVLPNGIQFDGAGGNDRLILTQTGGTTRTSSRINVGANPGDGQSVIDGQVVNFQNIEPITDNVAATTFTLSSTPGIASLLDASNAINYTASQILGSGGRITVDNFEPVEFTNKTNLVIDAGAGDDNINLNNHTTPTGLTTITVNGGDPTASDKLIYNAVAGQEDGIILTPTGVGAGTITDNSNNPRPVTYTGIERLDVVLQDADDDAYRINGTTGNDLFQIFSGATPGEQTIRGLFDQNNATGAGPFALPEIVVRNATPSILIGIFNIGGTGTDNFEYYGTAVNDTIALAATGQLNHTVNGQGYAQLILNNVSQMTVEGLDGDDTFNIAGNVLFATTINGGNPSAGSDVLNFTGTANATVDLAARTITQTGGNPVSFSGVEVLNIAAGANTIRVNATAGPNDLTAEATGANTATIRLANTNLIINTDNTSTLTIDSLGANDRLTVLGTQGDDTINVSSSNVQVNGLKMITYTNVEQLWVDALAGRDTINVSPGAPGNGVNMTILGGEPAGVLQQADGDILNITLPANTAFTFLPGPEGDSGTVSAAGLLPVSFDQIELLRINGLNYVLPDRFDDPDLVFPGNNSRATATVLGSETEITLTGLTLHNTGTGTFAIDEDFYQITAHASGMMIINAYFVDALGDVDIQVQDASGDIIAISQGVVDNEQIIIPVVNQQRYFLRVYSADGDANIYSLEIEQFPAPVPSGIDLATSSDTGISNFDNITADNTPRIDVLADLQEFVNFGITRLTAAQAAFNVANPSNVTPGAVVEVHFLNTTTGVSVVGFADPIGVSNVLFTFTPAAPLPDGVYLVAAAVRMFDGQDPSTNGRAQLSTPIVVTIDSTNPGALGILNFDMLDSSDSGLNDDDYVTNIQAPAFDGRAEANASVRIFAAKIINNVVQQYELIGQGTVGSDSSDVNSGGTANDGYGLFEITVEPLVNGIYDIRIEVEDGGGNAFLFDADLGITGPTDFEIDTLAPNLPLLDLLELSDSGRHNDDNITIDNTPSLSMTTTDPTAIPSQFNHIFPANLTFRIFDRQEFGQEVLIFDSFTVLGNFTASTQIITVLSTLGDGWHNLKLEVEDRAGNISQDFTLNILIDTVAPNVSLLGIQPPGDTGVSPSDNLTSNSSPTFLGRAEADAIVRLYVDAVNNNLIDNPTQFSLTVAQPFDGDDAFLNGQWAAKYLRDLNNASAPDSFPRDGLREVLVQAEDLAGNLSPVQNLDIFLDTAGPQVTSVQINNLTPAQYNLFAVKPTSPTPLINQLRITIQDLPNRLGAPFNFAALNAALAANPGNFQLVGDNNGLIAIQSIQVTNDPVVPGQPATATITLTFVQPLPDDRYTLTISDEIRDLAGNKLDGESNALQPTGVPFFPSGNGSPGGQFQARFTVDSRPEVGTWGSTQVGVDINGNGLFDPDNPDSTNRDISFLFGTQSDFIFSGNFAPAGAGAASGFAKLGAYGFVNGAYRWLLDFNHDGVPDFSAVSGLQINGVPVAGNFNPARPGDEIGLFDGTRWYLDTNGNNNIDGGDLIIVSSLSGHPIVGDFDGDGIFDLAAYRPDTDTFQFDLGFNGYGGLDATISTLSYPGVMERPLAADMDGDGITDIGLFVPGQFDPDSGQAKWFFLVSGGAPGVAGSVAALNHAFNPVPFGTDLAFTFGDSFTLPLVGNFDPPLTLVNTAPVLLSLPSLIQHQTSIGPISLFAGDAEGDTITYSVRALSSNPQAFQLRQDLGLTYPGSYHQNAQGLGEKWLYNPSTGVWYPILPSGELRRWAGSWASSPVLAQLDSIFHTDPSLLWNASAAQPLPSVAVQLNGNQLSLQAPAGFVGTFFVEVTASDGQASAQKSFAVTITNQAPSLSDVPPQAMSSGLNAMTVSLHGTDPDGDALTYSARLVGSTPQALQLKQQLGFAPQGGSYHENAQGRGEKWLYNSSNGVWHALLPNGELRQWNGSWATSPLVAQLESFFHADPSLLWNAQATQSLAYQIKQTHGPAYAGSYHQNAHGRNEKWLYNPGTGVWFALLPNGELRRLTGAVSTLDLPSNLIATLDPAYWNNPAYLHDAQPDSIVPVFLSVNGNQVTIDPVQGYTGSFLVAATVSDGRASQTRYFSVNVSNTAPEVQPVADQMMAAAQDTTTITLNASDADGDSLIYSAQARTIEAEAHRLRTALGVSFTGSYHETAHGLNGKWLYNTTTGVWYAILSNGEVRRWTGSVATLLSDANLEGKLDATYWADPSKLLNAAAPSSNVPASVSFNGNQLIVDPVAGFTGSLVIDALVSDGTTTVKRTFVVKVG